MKVNLYTVKIFSASILFAVAITFVSLEINKERQKEIANPKIVIIDSCEYIVQNGAFKTDYVHKANCKNHK